MYSIDFYLERISSMGLFEINQMLIKSSHFDYDKAIIKALEDRKATLSIEDALIPLSEGISVD